MNNHISEIFKKWFFQDGNQWRLIHLQKQGFTDYRKFIPAYDLMPYDLIQPIDKDWTASNLWAIGSFIGHVELETKYGICWN